MILLVTRHIRLRRIHRAHWISSASTPPSRGGWLTQSWKRRLQQLTDEAYDDSRRAAMQHLAAIVGHDGLCMTQYSSNLADLQTACEEANTLQIVGKFVEQVER